MKRILLTLSCLSALIACENHSLSTLDSANADSVRNGELVDAKDPVARKVFQLRVGYDKKEVAIDINKRETRWRVTNCTTSAITPRILLTAAHCLVKPNIDRITVEVTMADGTISRVNAIQYLVHPEYNADNENQQTADLGMVLLEHSLPEEVELVELPPAKVNLQMGSILAAGFGKTSSLNPSSDSGTLRKTPLAIKDYAPEKPLFVVDQSKGHGVCPGDSGGSALIERNGKTFTVGVVSKVKFTIPPGKNRDEIEQCDSEGVYVNVQYQLPWINASLKQWENE